MNDAIESAAAVGPPVGMAVRLSSNESAIGPSPAAIEAMRAALEDAHRYPDDQSVELRTAIAQHEGRPVEEVAVGTGSAGLLMDIGAHERREGGSILAFERGFIVYRLAARNVGAAYVEAPTAGPAVGESEGYGRDPDALITALDAGTRVVFIDNPGNPTGRHLAGDELRAVVEAVPEDVTIVVDEAYHQFASGQAGYATVAQLDLDHPRLVVTRTFSKAYGLAGLRLGYLLGPADLVGSLDAFRVRFNVSSMAQAAAVAALGDDDHLRGTVELTRAGRARLATGLRELGIPVTEGLGNFVTLEVGAEAAPVIAAFAERGIGVRSLDPYGMLEQIRVTVGTSEENEAFLDAARSVGIIPG